jgi:hypothetical protein
VLDHGKVIWFKDLDSNLRHQAGGSVTAAMTAPKRSSRTLRAPSRRLTQLQKGFRPWPTRTAINRRTRYRAHAPSSSASNRCSENGTPRTTLLGKVVDAERLRIADPRDTQRGV